MKVSKWIAALGFLVCCLPLVGWWVYLLQVHGGDWIPPKWMQPVTLALIFINAMFWQLVRSRA